MIDSHVSSKTSHDERTNLSYIQWDDKYLIEKPYQIFIPVPDSLPDTNLFFKHGEEELVRDIRGIEDQFTLDQNGFTICNHVSKMASFENQQEIENIYLPEIENLLTQQLDGADRVVIFDWRLRKNEATRSAKAVDLNNNTRRLLPSVHVHIDQTPTSALKRVNIHLKDEAQELLEGRVRIINAWRPIVHPVEDCPLAVCDGSTVSPDELLNVDHVRRKYVGESFYMMFSKEHRWHYLNRQTKDEVLLFKNYDSKDTQAKYCPHASFSHQDIPPSTPPRESIEVRALVFSKPEARDKERTVASGQ